MTEISNLFNASYGKVKEPFGLLPEGTVPLISSGDTDNGVAGFFDIKPLYKKVISVARTGSVGSAFYHPYSCTINSDCIVLEPKENFSNEQMFVFVALLRKNIYRYSYGRKVTPERLLATKIPDNIYYSKKIDFKKKISSLSKSFSNKKLSLSPEKWKWFSYPDVFDLTKGHYNNRPELDAKGIPFISATDSNNGITDFVTKNGTKIFTGKSISVSNDGSIGNAFYQENDFTCSHSVNIIKINKKYNKELNQYIALFLIPLIQKEKFRFNYGFKWRIERMKESKIKLPVDKTGNPDWKFMENYIKSLPYSASI
jgi:hypothetical protein